MRKEPYDVYDADGNPVYDERYSPCPGHTKYSAAVITLHYDSLFDIKTWWKENIYDVDDFDKENPNYSSDDGKDNNYHMNDTVLNRHTSTSKNLIFTSQFLARAQLQKVRHHL